MHFIDRFIPRFNSEHKFKMTSDIANVIEVQIILK
jgi:hypothetical protein